MLATRAVVGTIGVGAGPVGVAVSPDGTRVYVANRASNSVSVIDTATDRVVATVDSGIGLGSKWIAITPDGARAYVNNAFSRNPGTVSVIDTTSGMVVGDVEGGAQPEAHRDCAGRADGVRRQLPLLEHLRHRHCDRHLSSRAADLRPHRRRSSPSERPIRVHHQPRWQSGQFLQTSNDLLTVPITVGREPYAIALSGQGGTAYVANLADDTVSVVDLSADVEVATIAVGDKPFAVAWGCIGDDCALPPFTPKPTRTATPTPTITTTPTISPTAPPTSTRAANPDAVLLLLNSPSGRPGDSVELHVTLATRAGRRRGPARRELQSVHGDRGTRRRSAGLRVQSGYRQGREQCLPAAGVQRGRLPGGAAPRAQPREHRCDCGRLGALELSDRHRPRCPAGNVPSGRLRRWLQYTGRRGAGYRVCRGIGDRAIGAWAESSTRRRKGAGRRRAALLGGFRGRSPVRGRRRLSGRVCVIAGSVCDGGADDGLLCDCPGGSCVGDGACAAGGSLGICRGGRADGACCDRDFECGGGRPCVQTATICESGVAKGLPCLRDEHCPSSACRASGRACSAARSIASPASTTATARSVPVPWRRPRCPVVRMASRSTRRRVRADPAVGARSYLPG